MTITFVAFAMPFIALAFMGALTYGIARYNRRPVVESGAYVIQGVTGRTNTE